LNAHNCEGAFVNVRKKDLLFWVRVQIEKAGVNSFARLEIDQFVDLFYNAFMELKILYLSQSLSIDFVSEIERFRTEFRVLKFGNSQKVENFLYCSEADFFEFF
jgi:hypothetical protein